MSNAKRLRPTPNSSSERLDEIDLRIIACLQENARLSARDLARAVSLGRSAAWERRQRLERLGFITGYQAIVSTSAIFGEWDSVVRLELTPRVGDFARFQKALKACPFVVSAQHLDGLGLVQVRAASRQALPWLEAQVAACGLHVKSYDTRPVVEDIVSHRIPFVASIFNVEAPV